MKKVRISLVFNILIVLMVIVFSVLTFMGVRFMPDKTLLELKGIVMFKFYTIDSNMLMAIMSLILVIYEIRLLSKKIEYIPNYVYILKLVGVSAISLTFLVTAVFLTPNYGFYAMYNNNNLFFHAVIPLLSIISYIAFEKHNPKYRYALLGIIPMFIYSIYYMTMVLIHLNDGGLTFAYDFYGFLQGDINNIYFVIPAIYFISYLIPIVLIFLNRVCKKREG